MEDCKVNILGTEYRIHSGLESENSDGEVEIYSKTIRIYDDEDFLEKTATREEKMLRKKEVLRHEILHAAFFESGAGEWAYNEQLVDWFAIQSPKIFKVFQELDLL